MTNIIVFRTDNTYRGVEVSGHSGYADAGKDIVCAGISVLTINLINSLKKLSKDCFSIEQNENDGYIRVVMSDREEHQPGIESRILFDSYLIGIRSLLEDYEDFISLEVKEV